MAKTVLITGTSSGIGRLTAELFAARGWNVVATSRDPAPLQAWAQEKKLVVLRLDFEDEATIAAAVSAAVARFGSIDVLVNNAGYGVFGPLEGATSAEIEAQFRTNFLGVIQLIKQVMPAMRACRSGTIINVSSMGGRMAAPFASLYHASKFAIEGLSESFRYEASLHGIRVKLVEPAHFKTGFISRSLRLTEHAAYDAQFWNYMQWVYLEDEKAPDPAAVAETIFKAANDSSAKLRYPVKGALILALTRLLPDALWRSLHGEGMTRRPKNAPALPKREPKQGASSG